VRVKSVLNRHRKRDEWFLDDYSVNPYYGCSFGCVYCYVRGSRYGKGGRVQIKVNSPELLEKQLRRRAYREEYGVIAVGTSTEPYMSLEDEVRLTRKILGIIARYRFPVHILTKSTLVLRDADLIAQIDCRAVLPDDLEGRIDRGAFVTFSISVMDERMVRVVEPNAPLPEERLRAVTELAESEIFAGIAFIPVLPFISDSPEKLDWMIWKAKESGAKFCFAGALTLYGNNPDDCRQTYFRFIRKYHPDLLPEYLKMYGRSYQPSASYRKLLDRTAREMCMKHGIRYRIL